jgi:glycosyltransferase A (GT-A) superfamily protein (DUF2064 family)
MTNPAVAVMSRIPSAEGKSRLSNVLTPDQRKDLQWAFLLDTLDTVRLLPEYKCYLAATPADEINKLAEVTGPGAEVIPQPGGSLGQRMQSIAGQLFSRGHSPVVLIGTDAPALCSLLICWKRLASSTTATWFSARRLTADIT